jgi:hypothetical protein
VYPSNSTDKGSLLDATLSESFNELAELPHANPYALLCELFNLRVGLTFKRNNND